MRSGLLNERCSILRATKTTDDFGAVKTVWSTVSECVPCSVTYSKSGFAEVSGEAVYTSVLTFWYRWGNDIQEYDRIVWEGDTYRMTAIERYRRKGEIRCVCELLTNK